MTKINIKRLVDNIKKTNIYTPIIEALVNSIHSIEEGKVNNGEIVVTFIRSKQEKLEFEDEGIPDIQNIKIYDNGVGFNENNKTSFNTIYSEMKVEKGGKGFGRFTYLKYFDSVKISSVFSEDDKLPKREFDFTIDDEIIKNEKISASSINEKLGTTIFLNNLKQAHSNKLDKKLDTIARKIFEELLVYFVLDDFICPKITLIDGGESITLNEYLDKHKEIEKIKQIDFELEGLFFKIKVFKVYFTKSTSSLNLVADKRLVKKEALSLFIPEFEGDFFDKDEGLKERNYVVKAYISGKYLDDNVSLERDGFEFDYPTIFSDYTLSSQDICKKSSVLIGEIFKTELNSRKEKKIKYIKEYVKDKAPWHINYVDKLNYDDLPIKMSEIEMERELYTRSFEAELRTKQQIKNFMEGDYNFDEEHTKQLEELSSSITEAGERSLIHYISTRKVVLSLFSKSIEYTSTLGKYNSEGYVHDIIFPRKSSSEDINFNKHNLWLLDEKLNFNEYLASDIPISEENSSRPDIIVFNNKIAFREKNQQSNPITIFEFKKPGRDDFINPSSHETPIDQIFRYVNELRGNKLKTSKGLRIEVAPTTPFYGYIVCELNDKVEEYLKNHNYKSLPDGKGWYSYNDNLNLYIEIMCWEKILEDAKLRNRVFFSKLGIED